MWYSGLVTFATVERKMQHLNWISWLQNHVIHRPVARIFRRGVTWMCACIGMPKHARLGGSGGMLPQEIFRNQMLWDCFWGHFGTKTAVVYSYMARRVLHPTFSCPYMHLPSQVTSNFHERRYYGWQNSKDKIVGGDPLEGRLVNSRAPEIAAHVFTRASSHRSSVNRLWAFRRVHI